MHFSLRAALAASTLLICAGAASAGTRWPAEERFERLLPYSGYAPPCDEKWVLNEITWAFNSHEPWYNSALQLTDFQRIGQVAYHGTELDYIPRRYCAARALFNDGRVREVRYNLIDGGGFVGIGTGVEWCVVGLDRNHVYSPACKAAGP